MAVLAVVGAVFTLPALRGLHAEAEGGAGQAESVAPGRAPWGGPAGVGAASGPPRTAQGAAARSAQPAGEGALGSEARWPLAWGDAAVPAPGLWSAPAASGPPSPPGAAQVDLRGASVASAGDAQLNLPPTEVRLASPRLRHGGLASSTPEAVPPTLAAGPCAGGEGLASPAPPVAQPVLAAPPRRRPDGLASPTPEGVPPTLAAGPCSVGEGLASSEGAPARPGSSIAGASPRASVDERESAPSAGVYQPRAIREFLRVDWARWEERELPAAVARMVAARDASGLLAALDALPLDRSQADLLRLRGDLRAQARRCDAAQDDLTAAGLVGPACP